MKPVIVDLNCWASVFNEDSRRYNAFKVVRTCLVSGKFRIHFGGTKYMQELGERRIKLLVEFRKKGWAEREADASVDAEEVRLRGLCTDPDFDDPHIVGLAIIARARWIISDDVRSHRYLKRSDFYPRGFHKIRIYSSRTKLDRGNIDRLGGRMTV